MAFLLRDNQPTVVHCDTDVLRATLGIQEYLALPTVVSHPSHPRTGFTRNISTNAVASLTTVDPQGVLRDAPSWIVQYAPH